MPGIGEKQRLRVSRDNRIEFFDDRHGADALRHLLVQDHDLAGSRRLLQRRQQRRSRALGEDTEATKIYAAPFHLGGNRLRVDERLPVFIGDHPGIDIGASLAQQAHQLQGERIGADDANGAHLAHPEIDQVRNNISGATEAIALSANALHRQSGLQGQLNPSRIQLPVRIEAEIAEYRSRQVRQPRQGIGQPRRIIVSHASCFASARKAGRVIGSFAEFAAVGCEAKRAITSCARGAI